MHVLYFKPASFFITNTYVENPPIFCFAQCLYIYVAHVISRRTPQNWNFFIKNCVYYTCLNFSHLQSVLHLVQYTYRDIFSTAQNSFWTAICCFTSSTSAKRFPLRTFSSGETKNSHLGQDGVTRDGGAERSCHFWSKNAEHSVKCG